MQFKPFQRPSESLKVFESEADRKFSGRKDKEPSMLSKRRSEFSESDLGGWSQGRLAAELPRFEKSKSKGIWISFVLCVLLPTLLATVYFGFVAADQYVSEFRFSVRASDAVAPSANPVSAALGGGGAKATAFLDNYIVVDYITSRAAVDDLEKTVSLRSIFSSPKADYLARFNPDRQVEYLVKYWGSMVSANFDLTTGIAIVRVSTFDPDDSFKVASALQAQCEHLINDMNQRARQDAIKFAEDDVRRAEERLKKARSALTAFRAKEQISDPTQSASANLALASKLRQDLASMRVSLESVGKYVSKDAPSYMVLQNQILATEQQLKTVESEVGDGVDGTGNAKLAQQISQFGEFDAERQFGEKLYTSALSALEQARSSANSQHTYVAAYVAPAVPQYPQYPRRILDIGLSFISSAIIWCIGLLLFFSVREHGH